jgi:hypothetical protein
VIAATFERSDADLVGFADADGATPPDELLRLARTAGHADGAIASRRHPAAVLPAIRPLMRRITSAGFAAVVRRVMRLPFADTQCGAKVLRREVVDDVLPRLSSRDLLFDVDLLAAAGERGWRIVEVPTVWIDQAGSHVRPVADTRRMGLSLARLWARRRRGADPPVPPAATRPSRPRPPTSRSSRRSSMPTPDVALVSPYPAADSPQAARSGWRTTPLASRARSPIAARTSPCSPRPRTARSPWRPTAAYGSSAPTRAARGHCCAHPPRPARPAPPSCTCSTRPSSTAGRSRYRRSCPRSAACAAPAAARS